MVPPTSSRGRTALRRGATVILLAGAACTRPSPPLEVTWAGCAQVTEGPTCRLAPGDAVTLVVAGGREGLTATSAVGRVVTSSVVDLGDAVRLSATPTAGAARLDVQRGEGRFSLSIAPFSEHPVITEARRLRRDGAALRRHLERAQDDLPEPAQAQAAGLLARARLAEGDGPGAAAALEASAKRAWAAGLISDALEDQFAAAWVNTVQLRDFTRSRALLAQAEDWSVQAPRHRAAVMHHRAQLDLETFDLRSARDGFDRARRWARRHLDRRLAVAAEEMGAVVAVELGQARRAVPVLRRLLEQGASDCDRATTADNLGWALAAAGALDEADAALRTAVDLRTTRCSNATRRSYAELNRALVALDAGRLEVARSALEAASSGGSFDARMWLWAAEARGRLAAAEGRPRVARRAFARLRARAEAVGARDAEWRARVGLARLERTRSPTTAIALLEAAERDLEALTRGAPATDGVSRFLARHQQSARLLVELYLDREEVEAAHRVATRSLHRPLQLLRGLGRVARLDAAARAGWDKAIGRYAKLRAEVTRAAVTSWQVPTGRAEVAAAETARRARALQAALEDALRALPEVPEPTLSPPSKGEALVTVFDLDGRRALFVRTPRGTEAQVVAPEALPEALGRIRARRWALDAAEPLELPEGVRAVQVLHLGPAPEGPKGSALVVGNPTGDLAGSEAEAQAVADRLRAQGMRVRLLLGAEATSTAVLEGLRNVELLHYAGHARHAGPDGWRSALPLADVALQASDIVSLAPAPPRVVLSGCEAGRSASAGTHTLGLAHAFLVAGSREVVAPTVAVPDDQTAALMTRLYDALAAGASTEAALEALADPDRAAPRALAARFRAFERR